MAELVHSTKGRNVAHLFHRFMTAVVTLLAMPTAIYILIKYPNTQSRIWVMYVVGQSVAYWLKTPRM